jgi:hypothetical protein
MSCGVDIRLDAADPFSIPIRRGRVPRIRRDGCIVRVQHNSDCLRVQLLRFRQKPIGLVSVARRLLVQSLFGKRARTIGKFGSRTSRQLPHTVTPISGPDTPHF